MGPYLWSASSCDRNGSMEARDFSRVRLHDRYEFINNFYETDIEPERIFDYFRNGAEYFSDLVCYRLQFLPYKAHDDEHEFNTDEDRDVLTNLVDYDDIPLLSVDETCKSYICNELINLLSKEEEDKEWEYGEKLTPTEIRDLIFSYEKMFPDSLAANIEAAILTGSKERAEGALETDKKKLKEEYLQILCKLQPEATDERVAENGKVMCRLTFPDEIVASCTKSCATYDETHEIHRRDALWLHIPDGLAISDLRDVATTYREVMHQKEQQPIIKEADASVYDAFRNTMIHGDGKASVDHARAQNQNDYGNSLS